MAWREEHKKDYMRRRIKVEAIDREERVKTMKGGRDKLVVL